MGRFDAIEKKKTIIKSNRIEIYVSIDDFLRVYLSF